MEKKRVIVRAYGGKPLVRILWDATGNGVFITNEEQFEKLMAENNFV